MAIINELISQIEDRALRERIQNEVLKMNTTKKFGLVFEEHLPEFVPLYGFPIKRGSTVAQKGTDISKTYVVVKVDGSSVTCMDKKNKEISVMEESSLVVVAQFGEPIYPQLIPVDSIQNDAESKLWHTLIEADNYHALQLLEYLYPKKIDCIYIDPPYNTGTDDWKYNDAYVDSSDKWAHSKWLSMIKKRLVIAKRLLTEDGILVSSVGYQEVHRLVLLCEELFPEKQVVSITVQTSGGKPSGGFNYLHEYLVFVVPKSFKPNTLSFSGGKKRSPFEGMTLATYDQTKRPNQTYPIFVDVNSGCIVGCGASLEERRKNGTFQGELGDFEFDYSEAPAGCVAVWPISSKGEPCVWRLIPSRLMRDWEKGYIKIRNNRFKKNPNKYSIQYLPDGVIKKIESGKLEVLGVETGKKTLVLGENKTVGSDVPTIWTEKLFHTSKGTAQIQDIFGSKEFPYPKPLDLIVEVIRACARKDALILDFYAGSGTTLNAVNLLNAEDDGTRRCIIVTNNEVSKAQAIALRSRDLNPGDEEWESVGICRAVAWPRRRSTNNWASGYVTELDAGYINDEMRFEVNAYNGMNEDVK